MIDKVTTGFKCWLRVTRFDIAWKVSIIQTVFRVWTKILLFEIPSIETNYVEKNIKKWAKNGSETRKLPRWTSISNPNSQNFYKTNNKCKKRRLQINGIKMWTGVVAGSWSSVEQKFTFKAFKLILLFFEYVAFIRALMPRAVKSNTNPFTRPSVGKANLMPDKCDEMVYWRYL